MKRDVTGRSIPQLADKLIRQLQGVTVAEAKDALDYAASFLDRTQIVQAGRRLSTACSQSCSRTRQKSS
jgi:hypothetical protein